MDLTLDTYAEKYHRYNRVEYFNIPTTLDLIEKSADLLRNQEKKLYNMIEKDNYEDFIIELKRLFKEADNMGEVLQNFKKANLLVELDLPRKVEFVDQEITVYGNSEQENLKPLFEKLKTNTKDLDIDVNVKNFTISFKYNSKNIKTILNTIEERTGKRKLKDKTESLRTANNAFRELIKNSTIGEVVVNKPTGPIKIQEDLTNIGTQGKRENFSYTKSTIDEALKNPVERQQLVTAYKKVHDMLYNLCKQNIIVQEVFQEVWRKKIGNEKNPSNNDLKAFSFLSKGNNLASGVTGAVQEMYAAMLGECIAKLGKIDTGISEILGDVIDGSKEMPKTDVLLLDSIGIQVKAYSMDRVIQEMSTNIHPEQLGQNLSPFGFGNITDVIVQSVFNSTNGNYKDLEKKLEPALAQLMSLGAYDQVRDTVCFYIVDAQYLVPGSEILENVNNQKPKITIRTSQETYDDDYFNEPNDDFKDRRNRSMKPFIQYFKGHYKPLKATEENKTEYENLMSRNISIDVKFNYGFMSGYSIF